jgi:hypothetical protein
MAVMSVARSRDSFEDRDMLIEILATQLFLGRLALVVGAGISMGFGLPSWEELVNRCFHLAGEIRPSGLSPEVASERLFVDVFKRDKLAFAEHVRRALYKGFNLSMSSLRGNPLLAAIGALSMASFRGKVARIVSFNFDDVLERFLEYHGFDVQSLDVLPAWTSRADLFVYHAHGLLPSRDHVPVQEGIVFTQWDYDRRVGNITELWHTTVRDILSSSTCLFIGLSGNDADLRSWMAKVKETHVSIKEKDAFWGVRFSKDPADSNRGIFEERGVFQHTVPHHGIPTFLFEVCQKAAELSKTRSSAVV